jgi:phosphate transport system substrate-binding protein
VVSNRLDIDSISTEQLGKVLDGTYRNWSQLTNTRIPINIYGRQSNSGTYDFIKERLGIRFSSHAKQMSGNAQILEAIKSDRSGIGYVGAGYLQHGGIKGIKVLFIRRGEHEPAVSPLDAEKINDGRYFFQRPLFQYYKAEKKNLVMPFLDYEKSIEGKEIIRYCGYYPVHP